MAGDLRPFGELFAASPRNGLTRPKAVRGAGVKMVNMGELFAYPRLRNTPMDRVPLSPSEAERFSLEDGDLLFARQSLVLEGAGKCSIFLGDPEPVTFESHVTRVRLDPRKADARFYFYYLQSHHGRAAIRSIAEQGAGASGIRGSDLAGLEVRWCALDEQRAIAHILGTLDDKIELNRRMSETLEAMARALYKSWFLDFGSSRTEELPRELPTFKTASEFTATSVAKASPRGIPQEWGRVPLRDLASYLSRGIGPTYVEGDGILVVNQKCIRGRRVTFERARRHSPHSRSIEGRRLRVLDVLINSTGVGTLGRVAQIWDLPEDAIVDSHVTVVRAAAHVDPWFLGMALMERESEIEALGEGTTGQTELNRERLGALMLLTPPARLQAAYGRFAGAVLSRAAACERASATAAAVRDALLPKLISGELRVKDADRFVQDATA